MPALAWENLDDFLGLGDFAVEAVLFVNNALRAPINVIFDEQYFNAELGEYDMATASPHFTCKASDVVGVKKYDKALIGATRVGASWVGGQWYEIEHDPKPDGTGMAVVHMFLSTAPSQSNTED